MSREQPDYYASNGLSPIEAMKQGLISQEQYSGFLIGNIIKYVVRAGKKGNAIEDLRKAKDYINFYMDIFCMTPEEQAELDKELLRMPNDVSEDSDVHVTVNVDKDLEIDKMNKLAEYIKERYEEDDIQIPVNINNNLDLNKFKEDIRKALEEANNEILIMEEPTDDPNIIKLDLSEAMYDENGDLKPEAREKVKEYLLDMRRHPDD